ncbi:STAS domain-containing protein [Saccharothrix sp. ALI-22-I]|uniref:STAS domain-containing protein n=1 Tax=Saccharothrix sp. ALI-22-I TaxID=1933778 RepID=UPI0009FFA78C|nr:STAS domain-containing protein [Saccharothrix sp. ALI-22-I]
MSALVRNPARPPLSDVVRLSSVHPLAGLLTVAVRRLSPFTLVCAVSGEVDRWTAPQLRDRVLAQVHLAGPDLVVDLGEVRFFGAAGLSVLVEVQAAADAAGVGFCVVARTRPVLLPLTVTGLDLAFDVYPDVAGVPVRDGVPDQGSSRSAVEHGRRRQARPARSLMSPLLDLP